MKWSNRITMGCATPTVIPLSGNTVADTRPVGVTVRNADVAVTVTPDAPAVVAVTRYVVAGESEARDCHRFAEGPNAPLTDRPSDRVRETAVSRPVPAVTDTGSVGAASSVPGRGKNVTDFTSAARSAFTCCRRCAAASARASARSRAASERATFIAMAMPAQSTIASTTTITPPDPRDHKVRRRTSKPPVSVENHGRAAGDPRQVGLRRAEEAPSSPVLPV